MCVLHVYTDIDCLIHDRNSRDQIQEDYASRGLSIILLLGFITLATSPRCLSLSGRVVVVDGFDFYSRGANRKRARRYPDIQFKAAIQL
jgi:hypothetical protein